MAVQATSERATSVPLRNAIDMQRAAMINWTLHVTRIE